MRNECVRCDLNIFMSPGDDLEIVHESDNDVIRIHAGRSVIRLFAMDGRKGHEIASQLSTALEQLAFDILTQTPGTEAHEKANVQAGEDESPLHGE